MPILYERPSEVGADRIVNGVAAYEQFGRRSGRPLIVVDFGTATTFDAVTAKGEYLGGVDLSGRADFGRRAVSAGGATAARSMSASRRGRSASTTIGAMESGSSTDTWGWSKV